MAPNSDVGFFKVWVVERSCVKQIHAADVTVGVWAGGGIAPSERIVLEAYWQRPGGKSATGSREVRASPRRTRTGEGTELMEGGVDVVRVEPGTHKIIGSGARVQAACRRERDVP